jgi:hypothetical protein
MDVDEKVYRQEKRKKKISVSFNYDGRRALFSSNRGIHEVI